MTAADRPLTAPNIAEPDSALLDFRRATADDLRGLASFHDAEPTWEWLDALRPSGEEGFALGVRLQSSPGRDALALMEAALAALPITLEADVIDELATDFADIYLTLSLIHI